MLCVKKKGKDAFQQELSGVLIEENTDQTAKKKADFNFSVSW